MRRVLVAVAAGILLLPVSSAAQAGSRGTPADSLIAARVEAALDAAADLRADSLSVAVTRGVVLITGSVVCDECGGTRTPGGTGTVQQSLGAVVRAVPGVEQVRFDLVYRRP